MGWVYGCPECRICAYVCVRALSTHEPAHARVSRFSSLSHVHIRAPEGPWGEKERKRDALPSRCSRDGGGAQSFTDPLSPTHSLARESARTTRARANTYTHAPHARARARPIRFSDTIFPVRRNKSRLSCRETHFVFGLV